jgi:tetratricopeptide (TPR) repeat protein
MGLQGFGGAMCCFTFANERMEWIQETADRLTRRTDSTTINGNCKCVRSPRVREAKRRITAMLWAFAVVLLCSGRVLRAQEHGSHRVNAALGTVEFPVSCSGEAQRSFTRGVALLHSFTYEESAEAFRDAAAKDPHCAMAEWGLAMTEYHQLWDPYPGPTELKRGSAEIQKARGLKPKSSREKDYVEALGAFYDGWEQNNHALRARAYREAMKEVGERNPKDEEAAIFYALALIATASPEDKSYANQRKAATILEPIFLAHPDHPGVPHYLIHAYDNPVLAAQGVTAARAYSKIAPDVPHALHMPSHIFTRLGMWEDSVSSNIAAAAAARKHGDSGEEYHALDYLVYAYLQLGRNHEAEKIRNHLPAFGEVSETSQFKISYATAAIRARCAMEQKLWKEAESLAPDPGVPQQVAAISHWAAALGAVHTGNLKEARRHAEEVRRLSTALKEKGEAYWAQQVAIQSEEAGAWVAFAELRADDALRLMRMAADHEDDTEKHPITPGAILPARELLGDLLMELKKPKEALEAYEKALVKAPGRRNATTGSAEAARLSVKLSNIREIQATYLTEPEGAEADIGGIGRAARQVNLPGR